MNHDYQQTKAQKRKQKAIRVAADEARLNTGIHKIKQK